MTDKPWEQARLIPVSGINGADEQERRGTSALLAVINAVREFGRAIIGPLGAPAGTPMAFIEVPFALGDKKVRPDGLIQIRRGSTVWTALVEVKTGANELRAAQVEDYLDVAREQGFNAVLTISNQLAGARGNVVHVTKIGSLCGQEVTDSFRAGAVYSGRVDETKISG